jgi:hypothetical protein
MGGKDTSHEIYPFCVDLIYVCYGVVAIKNTNNSTLSLLSSKLGSRKTISLLQKRQIKSIISNNRTK